MLVRFPFDKVGGRQTVAKPSRYAMFDDVCAIGRSATFASGEGFARTAILSLSQVVMETTSRATCFCLEYSATSQTKR